LWKSVSPVLRNNDRVVNNSILHDVDTACDYFANISFDPEFTSDSVKEFIKFPQQVYSGQYFTAPEFSPPTVVLTRVPSDDNAASLHLLNTVQNTGN
jgi:hypothetical protein